jgi:alpha-beta hydrolase superfamily lysophospholipase
MTMTGILLVHGAWHGPWCWDGFAQRLAGHGHQVQVVRLRGHDQPPGRIWHRVRDYVADVGEAAGRFTEPPVLVGRCCWPRSHAAGWVCPWPAWPSAIPRPCWRRT